jgi:hypothetical protein
MRTGITTSIVASAIAALTLAAGAFAKPASTPGYDIAALEAMAGHYQKMAEYYGVAGAQRQPDGYQPQLRVDGSDVISRTMDRISSSSGVGLAGRETPDGFQPQLRGPETTPVSVSDDGFDWRVFGIATGSALLLALAGALAVVATRTRGRVAHS